VRVFLHEFALAQRSSGENRAISGYRPSDFRSGCPQTRRRRRAPARTAAIPHASHGHSLDEFDRACATAQPPPEELDVDDPFPGGVALASDPLVPTPLPPSLSAADASSPASSSLPLSPVDVVASTSPVSASGAAPLVASAATDPPS